MSTELDTHLAPWEIFNYNSFSYRYLGECWVWFLARILPLSPSMRPPRFKPDQHKTYYHVMTRTSQQAFYLAEDQTPGFKERVHHIISSMAEVYYVRVLAWVYMDNHYHLCLEVTKPPMDGADVAARFDKLQTHLKNKRPWRKWYLEKYYRRFTDLSMFMWDINRRIAIEHNRLKKTTGHFWGARFKSKVIEDERALLKVMAYIEQNPVRAGLCAKPSEYVYCSAGKVCRDLKNGHTPFVPGVSIFGEFEPPARAVYYWQWMDHHTIVLQEDSVPQSGAPPKKIRQFCLNERERQEWKASFTQREASDWSSQAFGSTAFQKRIEALIRKRSRDDSRKGKESETTDPG